MPNFVFRFLISTKLNPFPDDGVRAAEKVPLFGGRGGGGVGVGVQGHVVHHTQPGGPQSQDTGESGLPDGTKVQCNQSLHPGSRWAHVERRRHCDGHDEAPRGQAVLIGQR